MRDIFECLPGRCLFRGLGTCSKSKRHQKELGTSEERGVQDNRTRVSFRRGASRRFSCLVHPIPGLYSAPDGWGKKWGEKGSCVRCSELICGRPLDASYVTILLFGRSMEQAVESRNCHCWCMCSGRSCGEYPENRAVTYIDAENRPGRLTSTVVVDPHENGPVDTGDREGLTNRAVNLVVGEQPSHSVRNTTWMVSCGGFLR